jgi:hypothetical protein
MRGGGNKTRLALVGLMCASACGDSSVDDTDAAAPVCSTANGGTSSPAAPGDLLFVEVLPANAVLEVDLDTPATQAFTVCGHYEGGTRGDLTSRATFEHSNSMLGALNGAILEILPFSATFAGTTRITATVDGHAGEAQLTVVAHAQSGAEANTLLVAYGDVARSEAKAQTFSTNIKKLDVFINMDTTGWMQDTIGNLETTMDSTVVPGSRAAVDDTWFGVGAFMDFPVSPFGTASCFSGASTPYDTDQPFILLLEMTSNAADARQMVAAMRNGSGDPIGCGGDVAEAHIEALYQIATGAGLASPAPTSVSANANGLGGVAFRQGAMPVIVSITSSPSHDPGLTLCNGDLDYDANPSIAAVAATRAQTHLALSDICARVVTVAVGDPDPLCGPLADGVDFAAATSSLVPPSAWDLESGGRPIGCAGGECCTGPDRAGVAPNGEGLCPLVYSVDAAGNGVGARAADAVSLAARYSKISVTSKVTGVSQSVDGTPLPTGSTTADFIDSVVPVAYGEVPLPGAAPPTLTPTAFEDVMPATPVTFDIEAINDVVEITGAPQLFEATVSAVANDCADLEMVELLILVPPEDL